MQALLIVVVAYGWCLAVVSGSHFHASLLDTPSEASKIGIKGSPNRQLPVIWLHIHKELGTWACQQATANNERVVQPSDNCNWKPHDLRGSYSFDAALAASVTREREAYYQMGEYSFGMIERNLFAADLASNKFMYVTLLRDPFSAMNSNLNYEIARECGGCWFGLEVLKDRLGVDRQELGDRWMDVLIDAVRMKNATALVDTSNAWNSWKTIDNFKIRSLVGETFNNPPGMITEAHLQEAKERLAKFYAVGVTDGDAVFDGGSLFDKLGWARYKEILKQNTAYQHLTFGEARRSALLEINKLDLELYEYAKTLASLR